MKTLAIRDYDSLLITLQGKSMAGNYEPKNRVLIILSLQVFLVFHEQFTAHILHRTLKAGSLLILSGLNYSYCALSINVFYFEPLIMCLELYIIDLSIRWLIFHDRLRAIRCSILLKILGCTGMLPGFIKACMLRNLSLIDKLLNETKERLILSKEISYKANTCLFTKFKNLLI